MACTTWRAPHATSVWSCYGSCFVAGQAQAAMLSSKWESRDSNLQPGTLSLALTTLEPVFLQRGLGEVFTTSWNPEGGNLPLSGSGTFFCRTVTYLLMSSWHCLRHWTHGHPCCQRCKRALTTAEQAWQALGAHQETASTDLGGRDDFSGEVASQLGLEGQTENQAMW